MDLRELLAIEISEFATAYGDARSIKKRIDLINECTDRILALIAEAGPNEPLKALLAILNDARPENIDDKPHRLFMAIRDAAQFWSQSEKGRASIYDEMTRCAERAHLLRSEAGQVMPETPSEEQWRKFADATAQHLRTSSTCADLWHAIRAALTADQETGR